MPEQKLKRKPTLAKTSRLVDPQKADLPDFKYQLASNEYGLYCVPDTYLGREVPDLLCAGKVYEPDALRFIARMAKQGDIVSGGGFIGDFFPALSQALAPGAILHSFEPNPTSHSAACATIRLNDLQNVSLSPCGVGKKRDTLNLQIARDGDQHIAAGAKIVEKSDGANTIEVPIVPLDSLIPESRDVSVLHLDIEGHEMPALMGAAKLINRSVPVIVLEGTRPWQMRSYETLLADIAPDLNYRGAGILDRNCILVAQG